MKTYENIINIKYPFVLKHKRMSMEERSAQFAPFAALSGYGDSIKETARLTDQRKIISDEMINDLNYKMNIINSKINEQPLVKIKYFVQDELKAGGKYLIIEDRVKKIDDYQGIITFVSNKKIKINNIIEITIKKPQ